MKKKVLLAIDMNYPTLWAASYALHLTSRLNFALALMMVFPETQQNRPLSLDENIRLWLSRFREECNKENVPIEVFISCGEFLEEIVRFSNSKSYVQFIVIGVSNEIQIDTLTKHAQTFQNLHQQQGVDILLVWAHGK
jgi:hypothetical protein